MLVCHCVWVCVHNQPDIISQRIFSSNVQNGWTTSVVRWFLEMSETAVGKGEWQRERGSEKKRDRGNKNSSQTRRQPKSAKKLANENEKLPSKCKKKKKNWAPANVERRGSESRGAGGRGTFFMISIKLLTLLKFCAQLKSWQEPVEHRITMKYFCQSNRRCP